MEIYIVKSGDTVASIANQFQITVDKLIRDNGLCDPNHLVTGQAIVIAYPEQVYTVKEGDTLLKIANEFQVSLVQLLRNNPEIQDRDYIYIGEELVIRYPTRGKITTNAYVYPFIDKKTLRMTLPYLTYITVFNYGILEEGNLDVYYEEDEVIQLAHSYSTAPIMSVSSFSIQGKVDVDHVYSLLFNTSYQEKLLENILRVLQNKDYYGVNFALTNLNKANQELYINFINNMSHGLKEKGYPVFVTMNPYHKLEHERIQNLDYAMLTAQIDTANFIHYTWGTRTDPPTPVNSIQDMSELIRYIGDTVPPQKIVLGTPFVGYDWELPFVEGFSKANALSCKETMSLAIAFQVDIHFDPISQNPFYQYVSGEKEHIVWFIDGRTIEALLNLIEANGLYGILLWNIMIFNAQSWTIINVQYEIEKII